MEEAVSQQLRGERLAHTYRVLEAARALGVRYGADADQVSVAALMHDYAKAMKPAELLDHARQRNLIVDPAEEAQPHLLHGPVAAALLREQGLVTDPAVLDAIRYHTTGRAEMSLLEKVIWLADYIEPGRSFPGVEQIRAEAEHDLDLALLHALDNSIVYVIQRGWPLHLYSIYARNALL
ncbi:MAG: bis(5'-nucleosyl)-tetraphosphatase (symmetrical) YqeK [Bacillota bacterium]